MKMAAQGLRDGLVGSILRHDDLLASRRFGQFSHALVNHQHGCAGKPWRVFGQCTDPFEVVGTGGDRGIEV